MKWNGYKIPRKAPGRDTIQPLMQVPTRAPSRWDGHSNQSTYSSRRRLREPRQITPHRRKSPLSSTRAPVRRLTPRRMEPPRLRVRRRSRRPPRSPVGESLTREKFYNDLRQYDIPDYRFKTGSRDSYGYKHRRPRRSRSPYLRRGRRPRTRTNRTCQQTPPR